MTHRELPRAEWSRLEDTAQLGPALHAIPPDARIVVVEDATAIIGTWAVLRYVHVEGLWIAPAHRTRGRVGAHLLAGMEATAQAWGARVVLTAAITDDVRALIRHRGGIPLPGDHFVLPLGGA